MNKSPSVSFITETTVIHTLSACDPMPEDIHGSPYGCRSPSEESGCPAHARFAGCKEKALAGTSYRSSRDLKTPKDGNGCELAGDFDHCFRVTRGLWISLILVPLQNHTRLGYPPQGIQTPQVPTKCGLAEKEVLRVR